MFCRSVIGQTTSWSCLQQPVVKQQWNVSVKCPLRDPCGAGWTEWENTTVNILSHHYMTASVCLETSKVLWMPWFAEAISDSGEFHQTLQCYRVPPVRLMVPPVPYCDVIVAVGVSGRASQRSVSGARNWMKNSSVPFIPLKFYDYFSRVYFYHGVYFYRCNFLWYDFYFCSVDRFKSFVRIHPHSRLSWWDGVVGFMAVAVMECNDSRPDVKPSSLMLTPSLSGLFRLPMFSCFRVWVRRQPNSTQLRLRLEFHFSHTAVASAAQPTVSAFRGMQILHGSRDVVHLWINCTLGIYKDIPYVCLHIHLLVFAILCSDPHSTSLSNLSNLALNEYTGTCLRRVYM